MVYLLAPYGVPGSAAVSISLLSFVMQIGIGIVGGLFEVKNWLRGASHPAAATSKSDGG